MIDPQTALAIAMVRSRGTHALLLGSGVSRSAQIPTGWEIVLDLIRHVALAEGQDSGDDPAAWYEGHYGEAPDYSVLLERLTQTGAERGQIIRDYIEPSPEQRELGLKLPTEAHHAIARLVADGYIRVIVTTNFDRLLESALAEVGVVPSVVDSPDAALGTLPLVHNRCTVLKLHGDYVDARIKNTTDELAHYDDPIERLLRQVFREYGLIVCGWSGEWDTALVAIFEQERSPWFGTYWVSYREPRDSARQLIESRDAHMVNNMDADGFFQRLADNVDALADAAQPEVVSVAMARAAIRRFVVDPERRIQLHDLVFREAERVRRRIDEGPRANYFLYPTQEEILNRLAHYEGLTEVLRTLLTSGCYWGEQEHQNEWVSAIERLADLPAVNGGGLVEDWMPLRRYPAVLALYSAGIAAIVRGLYQTLAALLYEPSVLIGGARQRTPALLQLHPFLLTPFVAGLLEPNVRVPGAALVRRMGFDQALWSAVREYVPDNERFRAHYDRFEYLVGLVHVDLTVQAGARANWSPIGAIAWRHYDIQPQELVAEIDAEINARAAEWPPLRGGLFGGSIDRLLAAKALYDPRFVPARPI